MTDSPPLRVRFAPSPTGELHVGGARTALYDFFFARQRGGQMILRVEDTDQKRYVPGSMDRFMDDLQWLGVELDEGPRQGGPVGPYVQTERADYYSDVAHQLIERDAAYHCFCSPERLARVRDDQLTRREQPRYDRHCRALSRTELAAKLESGQQAVIRLKVPEHGTIVVEDLIRGHVTFDLATIDDQVLVKSDGLPTYHLAVVADDHAMAITHVLRAEEWLPSTPKHLLLYQAMEWQAPQFAHLPLMLAADRKKLSKRLHGESVWVRTYRAQGYLPEAMVNYLALVGWNPGSDQEFFTLSELVKHFSLERVHKAGAIFDPVKLDSFQQHYVQAMSREQLTTRLGRYLDEQGLPKPAEPIFGRLVVVVQDRLGKFAEFSELTSYFLELSDYPPQRLIFKRSTQEATRRGLQVAAVALKAASGEQWDSSRELGELLEKTVQEQALTNGDLYWPVRVALSGLERSAPPAECLWVLGRSESLRRLALAEQAMATLVQP